MPIGIEIQYNKGMKYNYKELCVLIADAIEKIEGYKEGTRSFRNKNPGNLWDGINETKTKRIFPKLNVDKDGYLVYPTYKDGRKALEKDILLKILAGHTINTFVKKFAPSNEETTEIYIKMMEEFTKINRNSKLKELVK